MRPRLVTAPFAADVPGGEVKRTVLAGLLADLKDLALSLVPSGEKCPLCKGEGEVLAIESFKLARCPHPKCVNGVARRTYAPGAGRSGP